MIKETISVEAEIRALDKRVSGLERAIEELRRELRLVAVDRKNFQELQRTVTILKAQVLKSPDNIKIRRIEDEQKKIAEKQQKDVKRLHDQVVVSTNTSKLDTRIKTLEGKIGSIVQKRGK